MVRTAQSERRGPALPGSRFSGRCRCAARAGGRVARMAPIAMVDALEPARGHAGRRSRPCKIDAGSRNAMARSLQDVLPRLGFRVLAWVIPVRVGDAGHGRRTALFDHAVCCSGESVLHSSLGDWQLTHQGVRDRPACRISAQSWSARSASATLCLAVRVHMTPTRYPPARNGRTARPDEPCA